MLILRTLLFGPAHGRQIAKHIPQTSEVLTIGHGSLFPALHRLNSGGWVAPKWKKPAKSAKREFKYYRLTAAGRQQLAAAQSKWQEMAEAIAGVMWPVEER